MRQFIRRSAAAIAVASAVLITTTAADTSASVIVRENYEFSDSGTDEICGLAIDFEFEASGLFMIRQGRPGTPTEFWSNVGTFREVLTNPQTGAWIVLSGRFNDRDVRATLVEDDVYLYRFHSAGQTLVVENSDGEVIYRERGLVAFDIEFDHAAPEGQRVLSVELVAQRGFPGFIEDLCPPFLELMT